MEPQVSDTLTPVVRLFVSSTFSDFKHERDLLQSRVFPALRRRCEAQGVRFMPVDLRWGVSEADALEHQAMDICLEEVRRSREAAIKPQFMILTGDRWGWQPLPTRVPAAVFDAMLAALPDDPDRRELRQSYREDRNAVPPVLLLKPKEGSDVGDVGDAQAWPMRERQLRATMLRALESLASTDPGVAALKAQLERSATAQEIALGALDPARDADTVLAWRRCIECLPSPLTAAAADFLDAHPGADGGLVRDPQAARAQADLHEHLRSRLGDNLRTYTARWNDEGIDFDEDAFVHDVRGRLEHILEDQLRAWAARPVDGRGQDTHEAFAKERCRSFVGRAADLSGGLAAVRAAVGASTGEPRIILVRGPSGCGKSSFMARLAEQFRKEESLDALCVRFIGLTPDTLRAAPVARLIDSLLNVQRPGATLPVLFLDALDQMPTDEAEDLRERVLARSAGLVVVASIADDEPAGARTADAWSRSAATVLRLGPLDPATSSECLDQWLTQAGRALQPDQRQAVLAAHTSTGSALHLRLLFEEARRWRSFDAVPMGEDALPTELGAATLRAVAHLQRRHGSLLVDRVMDFIAVSRFGLAEDELITLVWKDPKVRAEFSHRHPNSPAADELPMAVWSRMRHDLAPFLAESELHGVRLWRFFHRQFDVAARRHLEPHEERDRRASLVEHFASQAAWLDGDAASVPNGRKAVELPWQFHRLGEPESLGVLVSDAGFTLALQQLGLADDLWDSYLYLLRDHRTTASAANAAGGPAWTWWYTMAAEVAPLLGQATSGVDRSALWMAAALRQPETSPARQAMTAWIAAKAVARQFKMWWPINEWKDPVTLSPRRVPVFDWESKERVVGLHRLGDRRWLVAGHKGTVCLLDARTERAVRRWKFSDDGRDRPATGALEVSTDTFAVWSDSRLALFEMTLGQELTACSAKDLEFDAINEVYPVGKDHLVVMGTRRDGQKTTAKVWTPRPKGRIGHLTCGTATKCLVMDEWLMILVAAPQPKLHLWPVARFEGLADRPATGFLDPRRIRLGGPGALPNEWRLSAAGPGRVAVWREPNTRSAKPSGHLDIRICALEQGQIVARLSGFGSAAKGLLPTSEGRWLTWHQDGSFRLWRGDGSEIGAARFDANGEAGGALQLQGGELVLWGRDNAVEVWRADLSTRLRRIEVVPEGENVGIVTAAPSGHVFIGQEPGLANSYVGLSLWDLPSGRCVAEVARMHAAPEALCVSPTGRHATFCRPIHPAQSAITTFGDTPLPGATPPALPSMAWMAFALPGYGFLVVCLEGEVLAVDASTGNASTLHVHAINGGTPKVDVCQSNGSQIRLSIKDGMPVTLDMPGAGAPYADVLRRSVAHERSDSGDTAWAMLDRVYAIADERRDQPRTVFRSITDTAAIAAATDAVGVEPTEIGLELEFLKSSASASRVAVPCTGRPRFVANPEVTRLALYEPEARRMRILDLHRLRRGADLATSTLIDAPCYVDPWFVPLGLFDGDRVCGLSDLSVLSFALTMPRADGVKQALKCQPARPVA